MIKHLAIILDGNRRYAKARGMAEWKGHSYGAENVNNLLEWTKELGIKETTLYALSTENLKRDAGELKYLFKLFKDWFKKFKKDKRVHEDKVKIRFIGDLSLVPEDVANLAKEIENDTKDYNNYILNFCFAYGGRTELVNAFNKITHK